MKLYLFILFLLPFLLFSQEEDSTIVKIPDVMPEFPLVPNVQTGESKNVNPMKINRER